jgi:cob(I)alamin adenosyltransferase
MRIYTRNGDEGTTGLLHGGRTSKDSPIITALGDVDEAQSSIGVARALATDELHVILTDIARTLWTVMSAIAENPERETRPPTDGLDESTRQIEGLIDDAIARCEMPTDFVIPGDNPLNAALDLARAVVRRAERSVLAAVGPSATTRYLNRLSDLLWALARLHGDGNGAVLAKSPR